MRVLLVDDHPLVWSGIRRALEALVQAAPALGALEFHAVRSAEEALALAAAPCDLIVLDYHLPGVAGLTALAALREAYDEALVCVISGSADIAIVREVLDHGANGFEPKAYSDEQLGRALAQVVHDRAYIPFEYLLAEQASRSSDGPAGSELQARLAELSSRQHEVLALLRQGLSNKGIARRLDIAEGTVKAHVSAVFRVFGVQSRHQMMCRLLEAGAAGSGGASEFRA